VLGRPVQSFLDIEAAGGLLLIVATIIALIWVNSPWSAAYESIIHTHISLEVGSFHLSESLTHWINDGLMAIFFFVVGLEIKREWVAGELRDRRAAALPAIAALGGMVVPALIYFAMNAGGPGASGWGIPMATDIAFALGVVAVLGSRVPSPLKVFLLTLAIVDDIGAIIVIAVFYSGSLSWMWLAAAGATIVAIVVFRRVRIVYHPVYIALGVFLWLCVFESGVHATLAGVAMGLLTPATPYLPEVEAEDVVDTLENQADLNVTDVRAVSFLIRESVPLTERLEYVLHPWSSYVIVPIFAFANAGIVLSTEAFTSAGAITGGVIIGLVLGKILGISLFSWLAIRMRIGSLPPGVRFIQLVGVAALGGIGFTVSIFVAGLAFPTGHLADDAKIGVLVASVLAALIGSTILATSGRRHRGGPRTGADGDGQAVTEMSPTV